MGEEAGQGYEDASIEGAGYTEDLPNQPELPQQEEYVETRDDKDWSNWVKTPMARMLLLTELNLIVVNMSKIS